MRYYLGKRSRRGHNFGRAILQCHEEEDSCREARRKRILGLLNGEKWCRNTQIRQSQLWIIWLDHKYLSRNVGTRIQAFELVEFFRKFIWKIIGSYVDIVKVHRFPVWEPEKVDYKSGAWSIFFKESHTALNIQVADSADTNVSVE